MGESYGAWTMGHDAEMMRYISSANIACGFHAGDATTIRKTVKLAIKNGVAIGAHPSFPDLQGFGRREMTLSPDEIIDLIVYQVAAVKGICEAEGGKLHHVKPHGALYNQAARNSVIARAISRAVVSVDRSLILYGLSGSELIEEANKIRLTTASEVFSDRTYSSDGSLTPRSESNAMITDVDTSISQVLQMIETGTVPATNGELVPIKADSICVHGDGENAVEFAKTINQKLVESGISIQTIH